MGGAGNGWGSYCRATGFLDPALSTPRMAELVEELRIQNERFEVMADWLADLRARVEALESLRRETGR